MNRCFSIVLCSLFTTVLGAAELDRTFVSPPAGAEIDTPLSATLSWSYPAYHASFTPSAKMRIEVSARQDMSRPIVAIELPENQTRYRIALAPQTTYYWRLTPIDGGGARADSRLSHFTTGAPRIDATDDDRIRYKNPRRGAHWTGMKPVEFAEDEALSPWFDRKALLDSAMPTFEQLKDRFPVPVLDGHPEAIDAYWYCWKTLLSVWYFAPDAQDHQAVANLCGIKSWGAWGSTMVFDTAFILHFARYGQQAYPFVTAYDNCYARQHENGLQEADDSPRNALMHYAVSATSHQALAARYLARIAKTIGREDMVGFFEGEHRQLSEMVNARFWDEKHGIYNDLDANEKFITELKPGSLCKHVHMFWPLLAGIAPADRVERMVKELNNPASFNRRNGVPSLSADSAGYTGGPNGNGQYWCGAVWPSGQMIVQEGLRASGREEDWHKLAEKYFAAQLEVFTKEKTIKENMAPDLAMGCGVPEFVGWGGIGPVANLIEAVIGLDINAPENTITWRVHRTERHGLKNFTLNGFQVDLLCDARKSAGDPCKITIHSGGAFTLKLIGAGQKKELKIMRGEQSVVIGPTP